MDILNTKSIGVVITVYNKGRYLNAALESLLMQFSAPDELIVVDDCSVDDSVVIVGKLHSILQKKISKCTFVNLEVNVGAAEARNVALRQITSDYIVFLDADDRYDEKYISTLRLVIDASDDIGLIASKVRMDSSGIEYPSNRVLKYMQHWQNMFLVQDPFKVFAIESLFIGGGNLCFKRNLMPVDLFDPAECNFEEWDFYYRILNRALKESNYFLYNPIVSYLYNDIDESSLSRKYISSFKDIVVPKLIMRLSEFDEKKYRSLLISMWFYNSVHRLEKSKSKFFFVFHNFDLLIKSGCNRYTFGAILDMFLSDVLLRKIVKQYKKYRFS